MASIHVGRSEEEVGEKVDRCLADGLIKTGLNFAFAYADLNIFLFFVVDLSSDAC